MSDETGTRLFKVADIADALLVSKMTIYRMINAGTLPAVKFGRSLRVTEHHLRQYLESSPTHGGDPSAIVESILHRSEPDQEHDSTTGPSGRGGPGEPGR